MSKDRELVEAMLYCANHQCGKECPYAIVYKEGSYAKVYQCKCVRGFSGVMLEGADTIEKLLPISFEYEAYKEATNETIENLEKTIRDLSEKIAYWQAKHTNAQLGELIAEDKVREAEEAYRKLHEVAEGIYERTD